MNTNSAITDFEYIRNEMRGVRWADMLDDEEYLEYHDNESLVKDDKVVSFPKPVVLPSLKQEEEERLKNLIEEPVQAVNLLPMSCPWLGKKNETITPVIVLEKPIIVDNPIIEVVSVEVTDKRSRACKSVSSGEKCLKGDKCTFAHSVDELNPVACKFGMSCKFIFSDTKTCFYIHPEETKEMYCKRNLIFQEQKTHKHEEHQPISKRTEAFNKLSNAKDSIRKTKICEVLLKYGKCTRQVCNFAHNSNEYKPDCVFGEGCKKKNVCTFRHHPETIHEYCDRMNIKIPKKF
jgi:hypothetical protein